MGILNAVLVLGVGYIILFGLKDREPPTIEIIFPKDNYEFRTNKLIKVSATDNKGIKSVTYVIDDQIYHEENNTNPLVGVWNPCALRPGVHTLQVRATDFSKHTATTETIKFRISPGLRSDCHGTCDGKARIDECGVCSQGDTNHQYNIDLDCTNTCFGGAYIDECDVCSAGNTGFTPNIDKDCEGVCSGSAFLDDCDICSQGNTNHVANSDIDCNGDCSGKAKIDDCGVCSGGKTEIKKNADMDCNGICFGDAYLDDCMICSAGTTDHIANSDKDCNGDCSGKAKIDDCGVCSGGKTEIKNNADMDCAGICFGDAYVNECMYCIEGTTGFKDTNSLLGDFSGAYGEDCNQDCGGKAIVDDCVICTNGNTEYRENEFMDCNGDCNFNSPLWDGSLGGTAYLDQCELCSEGNSNHTPNIEKDCNGDCFGTAIVDPCGGCTGGNSGVELNQSLVAHKKRKYACGDLLFIMEIFALNKPTDECSSLEIINNEEELSQCISKYLKLGEPRWNDDHRLTSYTLPEQKIEGIFPKAADYTTNLIYLDISNNLFWGPMPNTFCNIYERGTLRIVGNKFCPPYPTCLYSSPILTMDMEDMSEVSRCNK